MDGFESRVRPCAESISTLAVTLSGPKPEPHAKPTRERLLEAAEEHLRQGGYSGLSLRDVAVASGIRKPGLYHHFPGGKDELVFVVAERVLKRNEVAVRRAVASASGAEAQLRAIAGWLLSESRQLDRVLRETVRFMPEEARNKIARRFFETSFGPVRAVIDEGVARGVFRTLDTRLATHAFFGLLTQFSDLTDEVPTHRLVEQLMDLFTLGVRS